MTGIAYGNAASVLLSETEATFRRRNPQSAAVIQTLSRSLPGGDTRSTTWFEPFPLVIRSARGDKMTDADGHVLTDFIGNYTSLVHGHGHPAVVDAVNRALTEGTAFAAPIAEQGELASLIVGRVPSIERVRFTNSGTEANLLAARIARAATGRTASAVARHSYHGSHDELDWHAAERTRTRVFPAGDVEGTLEALGDGHELAALFIEPVLGSGGVIPLAADYLAFLREFTRRCGALLVFDEVMTLRLDYRGRQAEVPVTPDLTTLGKLIGGGLPIGAVGGRDELMALTAPQRANSLVHGGTYNGNRLAMVAGSAALELLDRAAIARINALGEAMATGIRQLADQHGLQLSVTGAGSLLNLHARADVSTSEDAAAAGGYPLRRVLHLKLLEHGIFIAARGELCVSTAMNDETISTALEAISTAFGEIAAALDK